MNRRLLSLATAVVTFGAVVITSGAATAATAAAPAGADTATAIGDITAYAVDFGPDGEYVYDSHFVPADGTAVGAATPDGGVYVEGSDPAPYTARTTFHPPTGTTFAPGEYAVGLNPTDATVELAHGQNGQCVDTAPNGTLVVHDVSYDAGLVTSFAASARLTCSTGQPIALEMRWNSTLPVTRLVAPVNTASPVRTVTVPVTTDTTFGTAALDGPRRGEHRLRHLQRPDRARQHELRHRAAGDADHLRARPGHADPPRRRGRRAAPGHHRRRGDRPGRLQLPGHPGAPARHPPEARGRHHHADRLGQVHRPPGDHSWWRARHRPGEQSSSTSPPSTRPARAT